MVIATVFVASTLVACGHEHVWTEATCIAPRTCSECGATEGEVADHTWADATCTTPKTCTVCGETDGEALGHSFTEAAYATAAECSLCGEISEPAQRDSIVFDNVTEHDLAFAANFSSSDYTEPQDYPGYSMDSDFISRFEIIEYTAEPSDEEGYTDITIKAKNTRDIEFLADTNIASGKYYFRSTIPGFVEFDYYSGRIYPTRGLFNEDESTSEFTIDNEKGSYPIILTCISDKSSQWSGWEDVDSDMATCTFSGENYMTCIFHIPNDYDGLCLAIPKEGDPDLEFTMEDDSDINVDELKVLFEPDKDGKIYGPEDFYYIRVSDLVK